jgi:hypothetical protein
MKHAGIKKLVYGSVGELPFFTTSINYTTSKKITSFSSSS